MGKLLAASVKMLYRDRQALFWALAFPVIFAVVFGLFDFSQAPQVRIDVIGEQGSPIHEAVVSGLDEIDTFTVRQRESLDASRKRLVAGDVDVVLSVPAVPEMTGAAGDGSGGVAPTMSAAVDVLYNQSNFDVNQFAITAIERIVDGINLRAAGVSTPPVTVEAEAVEAKSVDYYDFLLPGLVAMGVMNYSIVGMAVAVARFREQRILKRILATPLRPVRFLAAQVVAHLFLAIVQAALILAVGVLVFGANVYGNIGWLILLTVVANLIFLNIGFAVAGRVKGAEAASGVANAVALPMMFLSGVFFPTDTLPSVMETFVKFLPLTPLIDALRAVSTEGLSIVETGPELALLGGWVVVSFVLATVSFRFGEG